MNRAAVEAELPGPVVRWLATHESAWPAVGWAVAIAVAELLLVHDGEGGLNPKTYASLCQHSSPAVRTLAQSAAFRGRKWYTRWVALRVAAWFQVSPHGLYAELRWRRARAGFCEENTPLPSAPAP